MTDTWNDRDLPLLRAIVDLYDQTGHPVRASRLAQRTGLDEKTVQAGLRALAGQQDPPYFSANTAAGNHVVWVSKVTGHARRAVGAWPTPDLLADRIVAALEQAADASEDEEERSRLRRMAAWCGDAGRDVLVGVAAAVVAGGAG